MNNKKNEVKRDSKTKKNEVMTELLTKKKERNKQKNKSILKERNDEEMSAK